GAVGARHAVPRMGMRRGPYVHAADASGGQPYPRGGKGKAGVGMGEVCTADARPKVRQPPISAGLVSPRKVKRTHS
ncbi:MAG: hypothetical protein ACUVWZ_13265, partial [Anaerolineae bacterium]